MKKAFSLIELLISLIIISLITASFVPILSKKIARESVFSSYSKNYNSQTFTQDTDWIVPDGVNKLRVFITGAGGSGASGSPSETVMYADIPPSENNVLTLEKSGSYFFTSNIPTPSNYIAPKLPEGCKGEWALKEGGTIEPEKKIDTYLKDTIIVLNSVTACGGGGGGGGTTRSSSVAGGRGGNGGYIKDKPLNINARAQDLTIKIAAGGLASQVSTAVLPARRAATIGGFGGHNGANGGACSQANVADCNCCSGGSGGGLSAILNSDEFIFEIPGGGGAGGCSGNNYASCSTTSGNGGAGGGQNAGLGGGAARCWASNSCQPGSGASGYIAGSAGGKINSAEVHGGNGGSGIGGNQTTIFTNSNCKGAPTPYNNGSDGAMKLVYSTKAVANGLSCKYMSNFNSIGGGGGGAGEVWIGEISVTPKEKISFKIGQGGKRQVVLSSDGINGEDTSIIINGVVIVSVKGGQGGLKDSTGGLGGGFNKTNFSPKAIYSNWLNILSSAGDNGKNASSEGLGGLGGGTYTRANLYVQGAKPNSDALSINYGTGGGGGSGGSASWNFGGAGADGVAIVEWK